MGPFLLGFADELLKVAQPWGAQSGSTAVTPPPVPRPAGGGVVRPPSTGVPGAPPPKPPNMMTAGRGDMIGAIPTQRLESPAKQQANTWRPSPGYRPSNAGDPTTPAKPPGGGRKRRGGGGEAGVPWESAPAMMARKEKERTYNRAHKANTDPKRTVQVNGQTVRADGGYKGSNHPGSYRMTADQVKERAKYLADQAAARNRANQAKVRTPAERRQAKIEIDRASADSALSGGGVRRGDTQSQKLR